MFILPQDAVKLGEVQVQGPPASPTRGTGMTSALLMEEDGGEGDRKLCCCVLCCRLCYRRCCGVIVVSARMHTLANMWHTISIILSFFYRISSRDATLSLLPIDLSSNTMEHLG